VCICRAVLTAGLDADPWSYGVYVCDEDLEGDQARRAGAAGDKPDLPMGAAFGSILS